MTAPARLTILSGFLGSGKTTWLRHQQRHGVFAGVPLIVNEAAGVPVDDALLPGGVAAVIAGGCACCDRLDATVAAVRAVTAGTRPARIVLETSGLADPAPIRAALSADAVLAGRVVVSEVVVTLDGARGAETLAAEPLARRQVAAADAVIVTRTDTAGADTLRRVQATLDAINPGAAVFGAAKGVETPLPDPAGALPAALPDGPDGRPAAVAASLDLRGSADWPAFVLWLTALLGARGDDILRGKGVVTTPAGRLLVQAVGRSVAPPEVLPPGSGADDRIVVIGRGFAPDDLARSLRAFGRGA